LCSRLWLLKKHDEKLSYLLPEVDDLRKSQAGRWFQDAIALPRGVRVREGKPEPIIHVCLWVSTERRNSGKQGRLRTLYLRHASMMDGII
jgi:hypothetical protein